MKLLKRILIVLVIGVATLMSHAQEEAEVGSQADPEVGSPLGGLVIAKGLKKLALFEGMKKIKLKLSKLGLKKGLFLAKIPWLASANPNFDGGQNMDGSDTYYIGIPEVGAHMWSGQNFDADFHPDFIRFEVEDLQDWHNHLRYHIDPNVRNVHKSEFISAHTEKHPKTEIYRFIETHNQPIPYHSPHFTEIEHRFDPFEQESQESRYYVTSVRNPNVGAVSAMPEGVPMNEEGSNQMQKSQYAEYSRDTMVENVKENSNMPSAEYHILQKEGQSKEINHEQIPVWHVPSDENNMLSNIRSAPVQNMEKNQDTQSPMLVWNSNTNIPRATVQEAQDKHVKQETQGPMYVWNNQKVDENSQPQIVVWQPAKSEIVSQNTVFDNMPHLSKEEGNVHPMIMKDYVQVMHDQKETSQNHKYHDGNVQMTDYNSAVMPSEYGKKATADNTEPMWTLLTTKTTEENKHTYTYPVQESSINSKNKIDVARISMEGASIEKRQMISNTCGSSAFTDAFTRLAEETQNAQELKSAEPSFPNKNQMINKGLSQFTKMHVQKGSERVMEQQQILSNEEVSESSVDDRTMIQGQEQMYYEMAPQQMMYQLVSGKSSAVNGQAQVVIDNQPLSAIILPSEDKHIAEVMPDHSALRTTYVAQSQTSNQQDDQQPTSETYYDPAISPLYQDKNPTASIYKDDAEQYRFEVGNQQIQPYAMQTNVEAQTPSETDGSHMMPQVPDHVRTFHKKYLFGIKKNHKFGGHGSTHYHYHSHGGYGGHEYGHGGYGHQGYGYGGHGDYSDGYGYLREQNPSEDSAQQEVSKGQEIQDSVASHMLSNVKTASSASNNDQQLMKPAEPPYPYAKSWDEGLPAYNDDRRLENTSRLRRKRSITRSNYLSQSQARCVQDAVRLSEKLAEPLPQRQICCSEQYQHSTIPEGFQSYSSYRNLDTVVEPYSNSPYYNSETSPGSCPLSQRYKELTIDANDPSKIDQEIYKKIMEHTEQSVREALAKASAEPLQINGDQIIGSGDEVKQEPEIVQASGFEGEGHTPVINLPPEQSLSATDILPAPSEKSVASFLPHDIAMPSYQYPGQYSNSLDKSPQFSAMHGFGGGYQKPQIDPLEALKLFDMTSTSGTTFYQLLDAIKAKLFACCEKCKDKILKGIHEKIEEEERVPLPSRSHRDGSYEFSSGKTIKDIYREVESLSHDLWTDEHGPSWENKVRRGETKDKNSLFEKKERLKKLAQFLLELKRCKCCSDESVEQYGSGPAVTSGEQDSVEITSTRKVDKSNKRSGNEGKVRSRKTKNSSASKSAKKNGRKKSKSGNAEEHSSGARVFIQMRGCCGYGSVDMVGSPFTVLLSRPYLGIWGPNSLLAPFYRQPHYFVSERFDEGTQDRYQRDSAKAMMENLAQVGKNKL